MFVVQARVRVLHVLFLLGFFGLMVLWLSFVGQIDTLHDALNEMARPPVRPTEAPMRLPVSGIYKIKGVGDVVAGRVEQGVVKPGEEVPPGNARGLVLHCVWVFSQVSSGNLVGKDAVCRERREVIFLPTHTSSTACTGKVFTVEVRVEQGVG